MSKIIVGMSGGVDSSVVAQILIGQGHEVIGLFMKNWEELDENGNCPAEADYKDVIKVCEKLNIDYYSVNFAKEYQQNVFQDFLDDYKNGFTPNPDVLCNKEIKFKVFFDKAMELGADFLATGHYCQNIKIDNEHFLVKGLDSGKDQTYFLHAINGEVLKKVLFPVGHLEKTEVRKIAQNNDLATKSKKDSTGICFIGERNFKPFLKQYIDSTKGQFKTLNNDIVGQHDGHPFYTLGQRKGLGLGGEGKPWFVVGKDIINNIVYVERGEDHPALYSDHLIANEFYLINKSYKINYPYKCSAKIRYRQKDVECIVIKTNNQQIQVDFKYPQRSIAPGQYIVFYTKIKGCDVCLGGARIIKNGPNYYEQSKKLPVYKLNNDS